MNDMLRVILWRQLDCGHDKVEIQMDRALAANAFYAEAMLFITSAQGLYFVPLEVRGFDCAALRRHGRSRMERVAVPVLAASAADLAKHAQVQRYSADKK